MAKQTNAIYDNGFKVELYTEIDNTGNRYRYVVHYDFTKNVDDNIDDEYFTSYPEAVRRFEELVIKNVLDNKVNINNI